MNEFMTDTTVEEQSLSKREHEIMLLLVAGKSCREVGKLLGCAQKTADTHRGHILGKLGVRNAVELTHEAIRRGWLVVSPSSGSDR